MESSSSFFSQKKGYAGIFHKGWPFFSFSLDHFKDFVNDFSFDHRHLTSSLRLSFLSYHGILVTFLTLILPLMCRLISKTKENKLNFNIVLFLWFLPFLHLFLPSYFRKSLVTKNWQMNELITTTMEICFIVFYCPFTSRVLHSGRLDSAGIQTQDKQSDLQILWVPIGNIIGFCGI